MYLRDGYLRLIIPSLLLAFFVIPVSVFAVESSNDVIINQDVNTDVIPPPPSSGGGTPGIPTTSPYFYNMQINPGITEVTFTWDTDVITRFVLSWGKTLDYESGQLGSGDYTTKHTAKVEKLLPNTLYYFQIVVVDYYGNRQTWQGSVTTLSPPDIQPPANVENFQAVIENGQVLLRWINPKDEDFAKVRIVKDYRFYPLSPDKGMFVYEGIAESTVDKTAKVGETIYYTIFSYDQTGNRSSGAVAKIYVSSKPEPGPGGGFPVVEPGDGYRLLNLSDFKFFQQQEIYLQHNKLSVNGAEQLSAVLEKKYYSSRIKAIVVNYNFQSPQPQASSYLFALDSKKENFVAQATAFRKMTTGQGNIFVYGETYQLVQILSFDLDVQYVQMFSSLYLEEKSNWESLFRKVYRLQFSFWLLILIIILLIREALKKKKENRNQ
jgi:hypothetical protein